MTTTMIYQYLTQTKYSSLARLPKRRSLHSGARTIRFVGLALAMLVAVLGSTSRGDVTISVSPTSPNAAADSKTLINIFIESTTDVSLGGVDFLLSVGAGDGTAGKFDLATRNFFPDTPNEEWDLSTPGQAFYSQNILIAVPTGTSLLANQQRLFGTLQLDLAGVTGGNYALAFDPGLTLVINSLNQNIANVNTIDSSINVSAVPEPSSMALLGSVALCGYAVRRWRGKRSFAKNQLGTSIA